MRGTSKFWNQNIFEKGFVLPLFCEFTFLAKVVNSSQAEGNSSQAAMIFQVWDTAINASCHIHTIATKLYQVNCEMSYLGYFLGSLCPPYCHPHKVCDVLLVVVLMCLPFVRTGQPVLNGTCDFYQTGRELLAVFSFSGGNQWNLLSLTTVVSLLFKLVRNCWNLPSKRKKIVHVHFKGYRMVFASICECVCLFLQARALIDKQLQKFCEHEQASTHLIFASNLSKGRILRALLN